MPQSLVKNYMHIVISTKYRKPYIQGPVEDELYGYIGAHCKKLECTVIAIRGFKDHVHIFINLSSKIALSTLVQKVKANSSRWMKTKSEDLKHFRWSDGYGAFSVSRHDVEKIKRYVQNQHEHHGKK